MSYREGFFTSVQFADIPVFSRFLTHGSLFLVPLLRVLRMAGPWFLSGGRGLCL